jgi:hypothetical protein
LRTRSICLPSPLCRAAFSQTNFDRLNRLPHPRFQIPAQSRYQTHR